MTQFTGYAIVTADGFIADIDHLMPTCLRHSVDFARFQAALDQSDLTLIGRATHDAAPNVKRRNRLIVSRYQHADDPENGHFWWQPDEISLIERVQSLPFACEHVAVVGGLGVFDLVFAQQSYDAFELTIVTNAKLHAGVPLFSGLAPSAEAGLRTLLEHGLKVSGEFWLDDETTLRFIRLDRDAG